MKFAGRVSRISVSQTMAVNEKALQMRAQGIDMLDGPNLVESGPLAGFNWIYFLAPWGLILEVASFAELGYERNSPHRLWRVERK